MPDKAATPDVEIAEIAAKQHGVISSQQLRSSGLSRDTISRRNEAGRLHRVHRGVYAVGHAALSNEGRWMAAVLACGAVLSHRSAAALWGLLPAGHGPVEVTIAGQGGRAPRTGVRLHRSRTLTARETTRRMGIPVTTPARTLADLRRVVSQRELRRAIRQADALGLPLGPDAAHDGTRSDLERRFLGLCRRNRLPLPTVNAVVAGLEVDFLWRERRLVVETDGYRYHRGRAAFEDDRDRDLRLRALSYEVLRLTYRQLTDRPGRIAGTLATLLEDDRARDR